MLKKFAYKFDAGPMSSEAELAGDWIVGNCRRAVQYYIFEARGIFLRPGQVLCPAAYTEVGEFVAGNGQEFSFDSLADGDIIYAERIAGKDGKEIDKNEKTFASRDEYLISLHTAIYTGEKDREIWHATAIEGQSCSWPLERFLLFYKPIAAKRIR